MSSKDEPCITPEVTLEEAERLSPTRARKELLVKTRASHSSALPLIPTSATALRTLLCGALSNALTKSNDKMSYHNISSNTANSAEMI